MQAQKPSDWPFIVGGVLLLIAAWLHADGRAAPPDEPSPSVDTAPFPAEGLRVLLVSKRGAATPPAVLALRKQFDGGVFVALNDQERVDDAQAWVQAARKALDGVPTPALGVSNGEKGFKGSVADKTPEEVVALVSRFAEAAP